MKGQEIFDGNRMVKRLVDKDAKDNIEICSKNKWILMRLLIFFPETFLLFQIF